MARQICNNCLRPEKTCICGCISPIGNSIESGILQHPDERLHAKGTAVIARLSLKNCHYWIAEDIENEAQNGAENAQGLLDWLALPEPVYLLYPPTESDSDETKFVTPETIMALQEPYRLLIIDASWRKSFKLLQLNPVLQRLPRILLSPKKPSGYRIRKQKNANSLSTVEAIYELLTQLEQNEAKYQPLLDAFEAMQRLQLKFYPTSLKSE